MRWRERGGGKETKMKERVCVCVHLYHREPINNYNTTTMKN